MTARRELKKLHPWVARRVQLHPATDAWMRGDKYGIIVSASDRSRRARIHMDRSRRIRTIAFQNFELID